MQKGCCFCGKPLASKSRRFCSDHFPWGLPLSTLSMYLLSHGLCSDVTSKAAGYDKRGHGTCSQQPERMPARPIPPSGLAAYNLPISLKRPHLKHLGCMLLASGPRVQARSSSRGLLYQRIHGALEVEIHRRIAVPQAFVPGGSPTGIGRRTR